MYKMLDLLDLPLQPSHPSVSQPFRYLSSQHCLARDIDKKNGVTHSQWWSKNWAKTSQVSPQFPTHYISPSLPLKGRWRWSVFPNRKPSPNIQDEGREGKHKGERFCLEDTQQNHDLGPRDAHLRDVHPRACSTWVISRHIFLTLWSDLESTKHLLLF